MKFEEMLAKAHEDKSAGRGAPTLSRDELIRDPWRRVNLTYNEPINVNANDGERISSEGTQSKPPAMGGPKNFKKKCSGENEDEEKDEEKKDEDGKSVPSFQDMYDGKVDMKAKFSKAMANPYATPIAGKKKAPAPVGESQEQPAEQPQETPAPETPTPPDETEANDLGHDQHA